MRYVAFLRAVNVGGRVVKMDRLRRVLADAGFENVRTYIQSGNVFFDAAERSKKKLTARLESVLADEFGFAIPVMLRTVSELDKLVASEPFAGVEPGDDVRLLVSFGLDGDRCDVVPVVDGKWQLPGKGAGTTRFWHTTLKIVDAAKR